MNSKELKLTNILNNNMLKNLKIIFFLIFMVQNIEYPSCEDLVKGVQHILDIYNKSDAPI